MVAVVAEHSAAEGGEPRPTGPMEEGDAGYHAELEGLSKLSV